MVCTPEEHVYLCQTGTVGLILQSLQLQAQATLASLCWCHKVEESARSRVLVYQCVSAIKGGAGGSVRLLMQHLRARVWGRRAVSFTRLALNVTMQYDRDFVDVFLLYQSVVVVTMRCEFRVRFDFRKGRNRLTVERLVKNAGDQSYVGPPPQKKNCSADRNPFE